MKECISLLKIAQIVLIALMAQQVFPQVGIGTTAPDASSLLHADDGSGEKGILIPSVALIGTNTSAPINPAPATSLLVYNVATSGAGSTVVTPGYYYWDGVQWVRLNDDNDNIYTTDGTLTGNRELTQNTNTLQFTGNVGRNALTLKRTDNSTETGLAFRNSGNAYDASIHMESPNSTGLVIASGGNDPDVNNLTASAIFNNDATTSFSEEIRVYEGTANTNDVTSALGSQNDDGYLELYENNTVNHRIDANGTTQFNQKQLDLDLRVATSNNANTLFVDGGTDRIGIRTNAPQQNVHLAGNSGTVRIESLNSGNNAYNVPADPVPVYVDNNGDLNLQPPLIQTFMPINLVNFLPATTMISTDGSGQVMTLLNTNLNLTQESLVHITYQFSVQVPMERHSPMVHPGFSGQAYW